jgi:hypothetical protein
VIRNMLGRIQGLHRNIWLPPAVTVLVILLAAALLRGNKLSDFVYRLF